MAKWLDRTGIRYGRLVALATAGKNSHGVNMWLCLCDCGTEKTIEGGRLGKGTRSCGCFQREFSRARHMKHGHTAGGHTTEYRSWCAIRKRCGNPTDDDFKHYGGRGIVVCDRWRDFSVFLADMGMKPGPRMSIDRIDVNGNYEPGNCRWVTQRTQTRNKRTNVYVTFMNKTASIGEWAEYLHLPYMKLWYRLNRLNWSMAEVASV
jgi:hypothetical protein